MLKVASSEFGEWIFIGHFVTVQRSSCHHKFDQLLLRAGKSHEES